MSELDYLGGFFDGEGSMGVYRRSRYHDEHYSVVEVSIVNVRREPIEMFAKRWGGKVKRKIRKRPERDIWSWQISAKKARVMMQEILPYVIIKREQIVLALSFFDLLGYSGRTVPESVKEERATIVMELKTMKWANG